MQSVEIVEVPIDSVLFDDATYPRKGFDNDTVARYRMALDRLPPIDITHENHLIDGYHRLMAHKIEGRQAIRASVETLAKEDVFWQAVLRNAAHGLQLSVEDKRRAGRQFFQQGRPTRAIADALSVSERSVRGWTEDLRRQQDEERERRILDMWLACHTQEDIAAAVGVEQATVSRAVSAMQNGKASEMHTPDSLQVFNLWSFHENDGRFGVEYPGRIPGQIVENVLYYYTEPFQTVVDPMAGGGTTIDVCKTMLRRYRAYDINPVRADIKQHDSSAGLPAESRGCDLIFLDPPYWQQKRGDYSGHQNNLANLALPAFYEALDRLFASAQQTLRSGGHLALIIGPTQETGVIHDHAFAAAKLLEKRFEIINRVIVPYTTQQAKPYHVADARKGRYMLKLYRDLVICRT